MRCKLLSVELINSPNLALCLLLGSFEPMLKYVGLGARVFLVGRQLSRARGGQDRLAFLLSSVAVRARSVMFQLLLVKLLLHLLMV